MAKITITLEDVDGQVGMLLDREGKPFDPNSQAHQMANAVLNFLDRMQAAHAPQMVRTAQEINAIKAATLVHQSEPIIIHGG